MDDFESWLYSLTTADVAALAGVVVLVLMLYLLQRIHNFIVEIVDNLRRIEAEVASIAPNLVDDYNPDLEPDWIDGPRT